MNNKILKLLFCGILSLSMVACSSDDGPTGEWSNPPAYLTLSLDYPGTPVFEFSEIVTFNITSNSAELAVTKKPNGWNATIVTLSNGYGVRVQAPSSTGTYDQGGELEITATDVVGRTLSASMNVALDYQIDFTDAAFEAYLVANYPDLLNANNKVTARSAYRFDEGLRITGNSIISLNGLELFPNLTGLDCHDTGVTTLDVSKNPELTHLYFNNNSIAQLSLINNEKLRSVKCYGNDLRELDLSSNTLLDTLECNNNLNLKKLVLRNNSQLKALYCLACDIDELSLSALAALEDLRCSGNNLSQLDLTYNSKLQILDCNANKLTYIAVPNSTQLNTVDITNQILLAGQQTRIKVWPAFNTSSPPAGWQFDANVVWER